MKDHISGHARYRAVIAGPQIPPIGGARVAFEHLWEFLPQSKSFDWKLVSMQYSGNKLKNLAYKFSQFLNILVRIPRADLVSVHASTTLIAIWAPPLIITAKIFRAKIQFRLFGADFDETHKQKLPYGFLLTSLRWSDSLLLETNGLVEYWNAYLGERSNAAWFPNARKIQHGVDGTTRKAPDANSLRLIYAGHVRKEKGLEYLLEAFDTIKKRYPRTTLTIAGRCEDKQLDRRIEKSEVNYLGEVTQNEIVRLFKTHDVFVYPSFWRGEGYPGVIVEALQAGLPIVCTDWRFQSELVTDGFNGKLFSPRNTQSLIDALTETIGNPGVLPQQARNSIEFSRQFESTYWNGEKFEDIATSLLAH